MKNICALNGPAEEPYSPLRLRNMRLRRTLPVALISGLIFSVLTPLVPGGYAATGTSAPSVSTCKADASTDSINLGKYFGDVLTQVRKDWRKDATIWSVAIRNRIAKNFDSLCLLNAHSSWEANFYSLSLKSSEPVYLDNANMLANGSPRLLYEVGKKSSNSLSTTGMTIGDMKKQGGWSFYTESRPELAKSQAIPPANYFLNWKMSMSQIMQKFIDRLKKEKLTSNFGFDVYFQRGTLKTKSPYVSIYWENGKKRQSFNIEPITRKTFLTKY